MITGVILDNGTPVIALKVRGSREEVTVEGILDTGFDGFLCLPIAVAVSLGLELVDTTTSELADGTLVEDEMVFAGQAEWDGAVTAIRILLTRSADVLIGTAFLAGYRVLLDYPASAVRVERVP